MRPRVSTRSVLRALLLVLLAASLPLKLWTLPQARAAGQAGDDAIREGMRAFLAEAGFSAQVEAGLVDLPAASGARDGCRVLLANVATQGYHRDLIFRLAGSGDKVSFLFRGRAYPDQPGWATWTSHLLSRLRLAPADPAGPGGERVYAVLAAGACDLDASTWAKFWAKT
jgi:hypothetical protein